MPRRIITRYETRRTQRLGIALDRMRDELAEHLRIAKLIEAHLTLYALPDARADSVRQIALRELRKSIAHLHKSASRD